MPVTQTNACSNASEDHPATVHTPFDVQYLYPDACGAARAARELGLPYVCSARRSDVKVLGRFSALRARIRDALAGAARVSASATA